MLNKDNIDYLKKLIHMITKIPLEALNNIKVENVEYIKENKKDKKMQSDIIVSIENTIINLEMNKDYYEGLFNKNDAYLYKTSYNDTDTNTSQQNEDYINKKGFCEKLINQSSTLGIKYVYISKYNINEIKECTTSNGRLNTSCAEKGGFKTSLQNVDTNFIYYLRTISSSNLDSYGNVYRLIVEFEEKELDYENTLDKQNGKCFSDYEEKDGRCVKVINKYYYNNVILKPKGSGRNE